MAPQMKVDPSWPTGEEHDPMNAADNQKNQHEEIVGETRLVAETSSDESNPQSPPTAVHLQLYKDQKEDHPAAQSSEIYKNNDNVDDDDNNNAADVYEGSPHITSPTGSTSTTASTSSGTSMDQNKQGDDTPSNPNREARKEFSGIERLWDRASLFLRNNDERTLAIRRNFDYLASLIGGACISSCDLFHPHEPDETLTTTSAALLAGMKSAAGQQQQRERSCGFKNNGMKHDSTSADSSMERQYMLQKSNSTRHRSHEDIEVLPNHTVQVRLPPTNYPSRIDSTIVRKASGRAPLETLEVKTEEAAELARSISELTMRSSYAGSENNALSKIPDNRRMAYYAVGKHHRQSGRGGNRRCYFTGKLILGGAPFYAGCVQQGLRTLVVFCLPSAIGLPKDKTGAPRSGGALHLPVNFAATASYRSHPSRCSRDGLPPTSNTPRKRYTGNSSVASKSLVSRFSSLDDLSLSIDGDLDPNWGLDRDYLLKVLPAASSKLLAQMAELYAESYDTLPNQVRDPTKWKLYVKFCFFSGLPIAEGEMHYKVCDDIAEQVYGEEIVLSHEVMEAVNGASADILTLPNIKTFRYLRKHYSQQCSKLDEKVFRRNSWERVAPEV